MSSLRGKTTTRSLYLTGLGVVYTCAFVSFWLQFPGLLSTNGLLPAASFWRKLKHEYAGATPVDGFRRLPCWLWFVNEDDASIDQAIEGTALVGVACGMLCILGVHHALLFAVLFMNYLTLYTISQTWLGFQWDIFLLETGAASILYAPFFTLSARGQLSNGHPMAWPLRALWVKFMVMSGVVKVTADCPTWQSLAALEYHFASTCLPTPGLGLPLLSTTIVAARYGGHVPRGIGSTVVPAGADHGHAARRRPHTVTLTNPHPVHGQLQLVQFAHLYIIAPGVGRRL